MNKLLSIVCLTGLSLMVACGPSAEDQAKEKATQDSIQAAREDSIAAAAAAQAAADAAAAAAAAAATEAAEPAAEAEEPAATGSNVSKGGSEAGSGNKVETTVTKGGKASGDKKVEGANEKPKVTKGGK